MTTGSVGPGTVLAGRYRLDDLLTEHQGARFWRATDTVLARSVAIHAVPSDDERAARLLDAARLSATVSDPHLLRVLDCDDTEGITWVVNEWGDGVSLDLMLQQGTLPADRAAWLAREVAEAIAAGHAQGVAHGRLNPEAVLVTHAGAVKLIGYVVDATLEPPRPPDPLYGELDDREADVINLAGILYAALTGTWPGVARSDIPRAPRESRRPLRPRQVRAGVPRTLDAICERVLHKEASQHALPIETAQEIAAALSDYVGDPALLAPLEPAGLHSEPTVAIRHEDLAGLGAGRHADPEATQVADLATLQAEQTELEDTGEVDPPDPPDAPADEDEATQVYRPLERRRDEQVPPPPPFEETPDRPLFATTERRVPAAAAAALAAQHRSDSDAGTGAHSGSHTGPHATTDTGGHAAANGASTTSTGTGTGSFWPFVDEDAEKAEVHTGREGRGWLRTAIVVGVLLVVVVAMAVAFNRGRKDASGAGPGEDPSASSSAAARTQAVKIAAAKDFDPEGTPPEENPRDVGKAIDGDPATSWSTLTYRGNPALGGLKSGVGLLLDLGKDTRATSVTVRFGGSPTSFDVYAASTGVTAWPDGLDQLDKVASRSAAGERVSVRLDPAPTTRYLLIWLTRLPAADGGFRGQVADVSVRS